MYGEMKIFKLVSSYSRTHQLWLYLANIWVKNRHFTVRTKVAEL